jgi:hypothetical protein
MFKLFELFVTQYIEAYTTMQLNVYGLENILYNNQGNNTNYT